MKNFKTFLTEMYFEVLLLEKVNTQFIENEALQRKLLAKLAPTDMARRAWADVFTGSDGETKIKAILSHFDIPHTPDYLDLKKPDHAGVWNSHVNWMISRFAEGGISPQEMKEVYGHLSKFHKLTQTPLTLEQEQGQEVDEEGNVIQRQEAGDKSKKFIANPTSLAKWKTFKDLKDFVTRKDPAGLPNLHPSEYRMVAENEHHRVFIPNTAKAACELGKSTNWCTTGSFYEDYTKRGPLYIIIPKNPVVQKRDHSTEKYQMFFESGEFRNIDQSSIDPDTLEDLKTNRPIPGFPGKIATMVREFDRKASENKERFLDNLNDNDDDFNNLVRHGHFEDLFKSSRPRDIKPEHYKYILEGPFASEPKAKALEFLKRVRTGDPETWASKYSDVIKPDIVETLMEKDNTDLLLVDDSREASLRHFGIDIGPEIHKRILTHAFSRPALLPSHSRAIHTLMSRGLINPVDVVELVKASKSRAHGPMLSSLLNRAVENTSYRAPVHPHITQNILEMLKHPSKEVSSMLINRFAEHGHIPMSAIDEVVSYHAQNPYPRIKRGDKIEDTGTNPSKSFVRSLINTGRLDPEHVDKIMSGKNDTLKEAFFDEYSSTYDIGSQLVTPQHVKTAWSMSKRPNFRFKLVMHPSAPPELLQSELEKLPEGKERDEFLYKFVDRSSKISPAIQEHILNKSHPNVVERLIRKMGNAYSLNERHEFLHTVLSERHHANIDPHLLATILQEDGLRQHIRGEGEGARDTDVYLKEVKDIRQRILNHPSFQGPAVGAFLESGVAEIHPFTKETEADERNKELELLTSKVRHLMDEHGESRKIKTAHLRFDPLAPNIREQEAAYTYDTRPDPNDFEIEPYHLISLGRSVDQHIRHNGMNLSDPTKLHKQLIDLYFDFSQKNYRAPEMSVYQDMELHSHLLRDKDLRDHYINRVKKAHILHSNPQEMLSTVHQLHDYLESPEDRHEVKQHLKEIITSRFKNPEFADSRYHESASKDQQMIYNVMFNPGFYAKRELFTPQDIDEIFDAIPTSKLKDQFVGSVPTQYITPKMFGALSSSTILADPALRKHKLVDIEKIKREHIHPEKGAISSYEAGNSHEERLEIKSLRDKETEEKQTIPFSSTTIQNMLQWPEFRDSLTTQDLHHLIDAHSPHMMRVTERGNTYPHYVPKTNSIQPREFALHILKHPNATRETFEKLWEKDRGAFSQNSYFGGMYGLHHSQPHTVPNLNKFVNVSDFLREKLRDKDQNMQSIFSMLGTYTHDIPAEEILPHLLKTGIEPHFDPNNRVGVAFGILRNLKEHRPPADVTFPRELPNNISEHAIKLILDADHEHLSHEDTYSGYEPYYGSPLHDDILDTAFNSSNFSQRNLEHLIQKGSPYALRRMMSQPSKRIAGLLSPSHIEILSKRLNPIRMNSISNTIDSINEFEEDGYIGSREKKVEYNTSKRDLRNKLAKAATDGDDSVIGSNHHAIASLPVGGQAYGPDEYKPIQSNLTREEALKPFIIPKIKGSLGPGVPAGGGMDDEPEIPNLPQLADVEDD